jgi:hypothetical protein
MMMFISDNANKYLEGGAADAKEGEKSKSKSSGDSKPSTMEKLKEKIAHPLHGKRSD